MRKLTYKNVFSKYKESLSDRLSKKIFSLYKTVRPFFIKKIPLNEHEKNLYFDVQQLIKYGSSRMPMGYDSLKKKEVEGKIELKYIDFFDYLPKENIITFKKELHSFLSTNKKSIIYFRNNVDFISNMWKYSNEFSLYNICEIEFSEKNFSSINTNRVEISIINLSTSFLAVKYRVFILEKFNLDLNNIYKKNYNAYYKFNKTFKVPLYKPWKFSRIMCIGNQVRQIEVYKKISELKWSIYCELDKYFKFHFSDNRMFTPVFETFITNIRPNSDNKSLEFWHSIGLENDPDYSLMYNVCVNWSRDIGNNVGTYISAYFGEKKDKEEFYNDFMKYYLSNNYIIFMVSNTMRHIAERDIAIYNKKISKAIRKSNTSQLLKLRVKIKQKLYYIYRFMSEFTGETIDKSEIAVFHNQMLRNGSITANCFNSIVDSVSETKQKVDNLFSLLDDTAEYKTSKTNMKLQWLMMLVTILSLVIAVIALSDFELEISKIFEYIKSLWSSALKLISN